MTSTQPANLPIVVEKPCVICALSIPLKALKCTRCQSFQNGWRRFFNVGAPTLAVVVALLTVVSQAVIPMAVRWRTPASDQLQVNLLAVEPAFNRVVLFVSNTGTKSAAIRSAKLRVPPSKVPDMTMSVMDLAIPPGTSRLIKPGDSLELILTPKSGELPGLPTATKRGVEFTLEVQAVRFDNALKTFSVRFDAVP